LEVDQEQHGSKAQLPQIPITPPKYAGDPAELIIARMLDQQFAGGQHLMLSSDGRFGPGYVTPPTTDRTNGLRLST
jgi:hypothetical protein